MTKPMAELNQQSRQFITREGPLYLGAALAVAIAMYGIAFPIILPGMEDDYHRRYLDMSQVLIFMHVVGAGVALLIAPLQFMIYRKNRILHRYLGRLYFLAVVISSIGGYYMAWHAFGGIVSTVGLATLCTLWWSFTLLAVNHVRNGNIAAHREWMIRSFALTYAAVTLRLMLPPLSSVLDEVTTYQTVYWLSWSFNLAVAQYWISSRKEDVIGHRGITLRVATGSAD
ncbi:MAG: DUF2306 domain-containing protein [Gammaproteobacteria bacterium]|nr:DUF2306 domain-containing protein [Gammaproteobacteria bacterium]